MRYTNGTGEAILVSRHQSAGTQQASDGSEGLALILGTVVLLLGLTLWCKASSRDHRDTRSRDGDR